MKKLGTCFFGAVLLAGSVAGSVAGAEGSIRMIAHRGGVVTAAMIENHLVAVEAAIQRGYWMVEGDVRKSLDGVPVVHHDDDFKRYDGDPRLVAEMTWDQVSMLRATPGKERPLRLGEYLDACDGRVRIMLDVQGNDLPEPCLHRIEQALRDHDQLETAYVIGAEEVKQFLTGKARVDRSYEQIVAAKERGEDVANRYFLFPRGMKFKEPEIAKALQLGVSVVPSVNAFHFLAGATHCRIQQPS